MSEGFDKIQPKDTTSAETAVENQIAKKGREHEFRQRREGQARVRELMDTVEAALAGVTDSDPDEALDALQKHLASTEGIKEALSPTNGDLDAQTKVAYRRFARARERARESGEDVDLPLAREYRTYVRVGIAVGHIHAATDRTRYAPVYLEVLDVPGARSTVEGDPTPIGRVRVGKSSTAEIEDRATEIPHKDAEHILAIANPRKGKDSLISRICGNLKDEHGYKWFSLFDDGRNETPMIAIPNDEDGIRESLESFGQQPKGYPAEVFVPAVGLPDELPGNHVPFTIGVDSLTTDMVAQLSGVNPESSTERRIKHALREVQDGDGSVDELIRLLEKYSEETSATITVTELRDGDDIGDQEVSSRTRSYELGEDKVLGDCAQALMMLASEGLLRDRGAETNLDMTEVLRDQEHVAVLNCNNLPDGDEHLKYLIVNIWLRLIYKTRDEHPRLPRAAIELREIKELAPSVLERAKYSSISKSLRHTLFFLSSQGGSRRVLLLGSTQYLNDVYKPIRGNMPIKILLTLGSEKIRTLESAGYSFDSDEYHQLRTFNVGWGMLLLPDGKVWPINWCGARCGLGLGDMDWLDRYGIAMGFRVQFYERDDLESWEHESETYIDMDGSRRVSPPPRGAWYLLESDLKEAGVSVGSDGVDEEKLLEALRDRQEYPIDQDLRPTSVDVATEQRDLELVSTEEAEREDQLSLYDEFGLHGVLREWTGKPEDTVNRYIQIIQTVKDLELTSIRAIAESTAIPEGTVRAYKSRDGGIGPCITKDGGQYRPTPLGLQALEVPWAEALAAFDD